MIDLLCQGVHATRDRIARSVAALGGVHPFDTPLGGRDGNGPTGWEKSAQPWRRRRASKPYLPRLMILERAE